MNTTLSEKEIPEVRFVRITRDPQGYEFPPAKLALRSACEFAMDYETVSKSRNIGNTQWSILTILVTGTCFCIFI